MKRKTRTKDKIHYVFTLQFLFLPQKEKKKKEKMKNIRKIQRQIVWKPPHVVTSLCLHLTNADARYLEQLSVKSGLYGIQFINALKHIPKWDLHPFKVIGFFLHHLKTSENLEFSVFWGRERGKMWKQNLFISDLGVGTIWTFISNLCSFFITLNPSRLVPSYWNKTYTYFFTLLCSISKAFIKPFEAHQRSVKIKA